MTIMRLAAVMWMIGCGDPVMTVKMPAPATLRSVESNAEGISDAAKVGDFAKATAILNEGRSTWTSLKPSLTMAGASADSMSAFDALFAKVTGDLTSKAQRAAESDANAISLAVPDFFDLFEFAVPSDALRGDGVFRQLQIEAEYSDWGVAASDLTAVKEVWSRLRPLVVMKAPMRSDIPGSSTVVADLDGAIEHAQDQLTAHDAAKLQASAQDGLDYIDVVETIFK